MESNTLKYCYKDWVDLATAEQIGFVDRVFAMCEDNYEDGGDTIVECWTPEELLEKFKSLEEVREYCGLMEEKALNCRWGSDDDPELKKC